MKSWFPLLPSVHLSTVCFKKYTSSHNFPAESPQMASLSLLPMTGEVLLVRLLSSSSLVLWSAPQLLLLWLHRLASFLEHITLIPASSQCLVFMAWLCPIPWVSEIVPDSLQENLPAIVSLLQLRRPALSPCSLADCCRRPASRQQAGLAPFTTLVRLAHARH